MSDGAWNGQVVSNQGGTIKGCSIQQMDGSTTEWIFTIDGIEADLGKFGEAVYKKIMNDAKRQRFQGFRPGTVPPHLLPTYKAFAMDEVCRETLLEAMQQNNIRPFESSREDFEFIEFSIPPPPKKKGEKKKADDEEGDGTDHSWKSFATMKEALDAGWQPGQSFSFVAQNVKGQKLLVEGEASKPINPLSGGY